MSILAKITGRTQVLAFVGVAGATMAMQTFATPFLTISGSTVTVEQAGIDQVSTSASSLLTTMFEFLKFLPQLALIAGAFFLLHKIIGIIKGMGGGGAK